MFEPAKQAFFGHEAGDEGQVGLGVLGGQAACGVGGLVGDVKAPLGLEPALALVVFEDGIQDVEDVEALVDGAVLLLAQCGQPGFDGELVAGQAAVGSQELGAADVAVEGAQVGAAGIGEQLQQHGLAHQSVQVQIGVQAEAAQQELGAAKARVCADCSVVSLSVIAGMIWGVICGVEAFDRVQPLGQQAGRGQ